MSDKDIEVVFEAASGMPGIADNMSSRHMLRFNCFNVVGPNRYEEFLIRFPRPEIDGAINLNASSRHEMTDSELVFRAEQHPNANNPSRSQVRIQWNNNHNHPADGYKYEVEMRQQVLDPRVRPR